MTVPKTTRPWVLGSRVAGTVGRVWAVILARFDGSPSSKPELPAGSRYKPMQGGRCDSCWDALDP